MEKRKTWFYSLIGAAAGFLNGLFGAGAAPSGTTVGNDGAGIKKSPCHVHSHYTSLICVQRMCILVGNFSSLGGGPFLSSVGGRRSSDRRMASEEDRQ